MEFLTGPCFILSLLVFVVGLIARAVWYVRGLDWRLERVSYRYHSDRSIPGAIASIVRWLIPAGTNGWRTQPVSMLAFFLLHVEEPFLVPSRRFTISRNLLSMTFSFSLPRILSGNFSANVSIVQPTKKFSGSSLDTSPPP